MICGVDPGRTGALAVLHDDGTIAEIVDMPAIEVIVGGKKRLRVSAAGIAGFFHKWKSAADEFTIIIEETQPMRKMGEVGAFGLGRNSGLAEGAAAGARVSLQPVRPQAWKKYFGLHADKGGSRLRAQQQWPNQASLFTRVKDDGRAEAALIALYGLKRAE